MHTTFSKIPRISLRVFPSRSMNLLVGLFSPLLLIVGSACKDVTSKLHAGTVDPSTYTSPEAAQAMTRNARFLFHETLLYFMLESGRITDEFYDQQSASRVIGYFDSRVVLDQRHLPDEALLKTLLSDTISAILSYNKLQKVRSRSSLAIGALHAYAPETPATLRAELVSYEAFAEVMLADLYCSGIPLSTVVFQGDFIYRPGSSTREVYEHAITLFDSALTLAQGDPATRHLAAIGKARALLALGKYAEAASVVVEIPDGFVFDLPVYGDRFVSESAPTGFRWSTDIGTRGGSVANGKGGKGILYRTPRDPRILLIDSTASRRYWLPAERKRISVATFLEARLIAAETRIQADDVSYLHLLNALRTNGTYTIGTGGDTLWNAGTGGVARLAPLTDPTLTSLPEGTTLLDARIDLLMRERALWLFFTGHRQGDLRRLIRNYGRTIEETYPQGSHPAGIGEYDQYIDVPMPNTERFNPHFTGCHGRGE